MILATNPDQTKKAGCHRHTPEQHEDDNDGSHRLQNVHLRARQTGTSCMRHKT